MGGRKGCKMGGKNAVMEDARLELADEGAVRGGYGDVKVALILLI
jgi:hypothetical protein